MKKRLFALLVATMVLVLGMAQVASAGWGGSMSRAWGSGSPPQLNAANWQSPAAFLGLTDEQSEKLKKNQQECYNNSQELRAKLQKAMFDLRQLGWEKNPDQNKLNAKINEVNNLRNQLYQQNQQYRNQMTSVLTKDQLAKIGQQGFGRGGKGFGCRGGMWEFQGTAQ